MNIILVVLHKLLQRIVRRNSNRRIFFNNFAITRKINTTRLLRKLREVKFIVLLDPFNKIPPFFNTSSLEYPTRGGIQHLLVLTRKPDIKFVSIISLGSSWLGHLSIRDFSLPQA